jgi:hypothetical protein
VGEISKAVGESADFLDDQVNGFVPPLETPSVSK